MKIQTLHYHLNILINGSHYSTFDFEAAYNYWAIKSRKYVTFNNTNENIMDY